MIDPQQPQKLEWVKSLLPIITALVGAVVGFISAIVVDILKTNRQRKQAIHDIRVALYHELGFLYASAYGWCNQIIPSDQHQDAIGNGLRNSAITTYQWAKTQPHLFYQLKEAHIVDVLYDSFMVMKNMFNGPGVGKHVIDIAKNFLALMEKDIEQKVFDLELFEKEVPNYFQMIKQSIEKKKSLAKAQGK